jgi:hypothetical protein
MVNGDLLAPEQVKFPRGQPAAALRAPPALGVAGDPGPGGAACGPDGEEAPAQGARPPLILPLLTPDLSFLTAVQRAARIHKSGGFMYFYDKLWIFFVVALHIPVFLY